ncbi:MAG: hypothetical protein ABIY56_11385, partial [Dokdonella sp.]
TVDSAAEFNKIVSARLLNWMTTMDCARKGLVTDNRATVIGAALDDVVVVAHIGPCDAQPERT